MATAATASVVPMRHASPFHYPATHSSGNAKAAEALFEALATSNLSVVEDAGALPLPISGATATTEASTSAAAPAVAVVEDASTMPHVHVQQLPTPRTSFSSSGTVSPPDNLSPGSRRYQNQLPQQHPQFHHHQPPFPHQSSSASAYFATPASTTVPSTIASSLDPTLNPTAGSPFAASDSSSSPSVTVQHDAGFFSSGQATSFSSQRATTSSGNASLIYTSSSSTSLSSSSTLPVNFSSSPLERGVSGQGPLSTNHPSSYLSERYPTAQSAKGGYAFADTSATSTLPPQAYVQEVLPNENEQLLYDQQEQQKKKARSALNGFAAILPPSLNHSLSNAIHSVHTIIDERRDGSFSLPSNRDGLPTSSSAGSGVGVRSRSFSGLFKRVYKASKLPALCLLWYLSSAVTNNIGKQIMNQFRYPVTLTFIQFVFVSIFCFLSGSVLRLTNIRRPTIGIIQMTAPLVGFQVVGHVFSSIAISRVPLSVVHTIKALSPLFTVMFYRFLLGTTYNRSVYLSLVPLTAGVMLATRLSLEFNNLVGLICALFSCLVFVTQNVFTKRILFSAKSKAGSSAGGLGNKEVVSEEEATGSQNAQKLDKLNILFYSSTMAAICMVPMWLYAEGFSLLFSEDSSAFHHVSGHSGTVGIAWLLLLNGVSHYFQNIFAFSVLSLTSPVTYSIASLIKRIVVIVASIFYFRQTLGLTQWTGVCMTFWGLWLYNSAKNASKNSGGSALEGSGRFKLKMGQRSSGAGASGGLLGSWSTASAGSLPFTTSSSDGVARLSDWKSQQQQRYGQHAWQS